MSRRQVVFRGVAVSVMASSALNLFSTTAALGQSTPRTRTAAPNVWAAINAPVRDDLAELPPRVYVPDEIGGDIVVIDANSRTIVDRFPVGRTPHHVTPRTT